MKCLHRVVWSTNILTLHTDDIQYSVVFVKSHTYSYSITEAQNYSSPSVWEYIMNIQTDIPAYVRTETQHTEHVALTFRAGVVAPSHRRTVAPSHRRTVASQRSAPRIGAHRYVWSSWCVSRAFVSTHSEVRFLARLFDTGECICEACACRDADTWVEL